MEKVAVILAGGGGTRFWPLSRQNKPKQLINLSGNDIMLNDTVRRYESVISAANTVIVTNKSQSDLLYSILHPDVPRKNVLKEPVGRNTAACILYAALYIKKKYGDAIMVVLPSDHYFTDTKAFGRILDNTCDVAIKTDKLVTIGIKPSFPATGYGYINLNSKVKVDTPVDAYEVAEFVEKPQFEKAKKYVESGKYLWNSGMFVWKTSTILDNFERYLPRIYNRMMEGYEYLGTDKEEDYIEKIYPSLQSISIDFGILERSDDVLVVPGDFGWNDVGSWDALGAIFPPDENGNIVKAKYIGLDTKNSIIYGNGRLITTIGIDNLIIADTDDALLICPKDKAQEVKKLVDLMKEREMNDYI